MALTVRTVIPEAVLALSMFVPTITTSISLATPRAAQAHMEIKPSKHTSEQRQKPTNIGYNLTKIKFFFKKTSLSREFISVLSKKALYTQFLLKNHKM